MRPIFDAHLDLAWNAISFERDLSLPVDLIRRREQGMTDHPSRARNTVSLPELLRGNVTTCVATLLARSGPDVTFCADRKRTDLDYPSQTLAAQAAREQLAHYQQLERRNHARIVRSASDLREGAALGMILSMEGADPIVEPSHVHDWWNLGVRAIGLAHYGRGQYACGTGVDGPLSDRGVALLREMQQLGIILDVTHLSDTSMRQALDTFDGPVLASHHNCRALVPGDRQLADEQIRQLIARGAVIGVALDAWMLSPNWIKGVTQPRVVTLEAAVDHIVHVCQIAGNARHCGIGSDLDGGFGIEQTPCDLDTIADLQELGEILVRRGFGDADIDAIFHGNWRRFFAHALPE